MIELAIPGRDALSLQHAVFDLNGTLALDGSLLPEISGRLSRLASVLECQVASADTHGTLAQVGAALGLPVAVVRDGEDKARMVRSLGASSVVAIGNGRNDVPMFQAAALAIAVLGPEGADPHALMAADIVVANPLDALDLLLSPARLRATLRI